jgi:hypothetical protein
MVYFDSAEIYIRSARNLEERINKIGQIIDALENTMLSAAGKGDIEEYSLDDGQTTIRTKYRDMNAIRLSIAGFDALQDRLIAKLNNRNGRVIRFVDSKNF